MELFNKTYHLTFIYTVIANDEPILTPKIPTTFRHEDGTETIEDTQQVKRLLLALLNGKKSMLDNMILQKIAYQLSSDEGDQVYEMVTGENIEVLNNSLETGLVENLQKEDKEHFERYDGMELVFKLDKAFDLELEQVAFGEVQHQHQHTHTQSSPPEKKRHHKKKPGRR